MKTEIFFKSIFQVKFSWGLSQVTRSTLSLFRMQAASVALARISSNGIRVRGNGSISLPLTRSYAFRFPSGLEIHFFAFSLLDLFAVLLPKGPLLEPCTQIQHNFI